MTRRIDPAHIAELGLDDWRYLLKRLEATFTCASYAEAGALAARIGALADEQNHHPNLDIRYPGVVHVVTTSHDVGGVTERDLTLARAISELAAATPGVTSAPLASTTTEIAIDAMDINAVRPFWAALLGYVDDLPAVEGDIVRQIVDPRGIGPTVWFQQMDEPRPQRNRIHLDVAVPHDVAKERVEAALAAGGHVVSDAWARAFWVLADVEGNEACIVTWQDRGATPS